MDRDHKNASEDLQGESRFKFYDQKWNKSFLIVYPKLTRGIFFLRTSATPNKPNLPGKLTTIPRSTERKNILIAEIMTAFRDLVTHAAAKVDSTASTGQAAYSSMALEFTMSSLIKSTEDLLSLTRRLRELWVVGPLRAPGEGDEQAEATMRHDADTVLAMLNALRDGERQRLLAQAAGDTGCLTLER
ncbi:hypothetical protein N656DRAFT_740661, partial [Canariomyces notabilis]